MQTTLINTCLCLDEDIGGKLYNNTVYMGNSGIRGGVGRCYVEIRDERFSTAYNSRI